MDEPGQVLDLKSLDQVLADALDANLELQAERADIDRLKALVRAANRDRLPTLDLVGALGGNGLSGTGQNVVFGADTLRSTQSGGYGDALGQVLKRDNPTWEVGLLLDIPIGAHTGRGESDLLRAEAARAEYNYAAAQRDLEAQVRDQYRAVAHGKQRLTLARSGVDAAAEQVRIGVIEYRNGRSTAFELVRLAADFAAAQQRYSQALVRTAKAESQLRYLTSGQHPQ
jgi:outer membrane protein TolC